MLDCARGSRRCVRRRRNVISRHAEVLRDGRGRAVLSILVLMFLPAIFVVDVLLAGGTVDYLISQSFDTKTLAWGYLILLKIVVLAMIIIIELKIALTISHALDRGYRAVIVPAVAGLAVAFLMAFMSYVVATATVANQELIGAARWLPWAAAAFTLVLHALAVFSGDSVRIAFRLLSFWVQWAYILALRASFNLRAQRGQRLVGRSYRAYIARLGRHNHEYPEARLRYGPVENDVQAVLETLFTAADLRRGRGGDPEEEREPDPPQPTAPAAAPTREDCSEEPVADYSAFVAEEEARRAETEVTA